MCSTFPLESLRLSDTNPINFDPDGVRRLTRISTSNVKTDIALFILFFFYLFQCIDFCVEQIVKDMSTRCIGFLSLSLSGILFFTIDILNVFFFEDISK